VRKRVQRMKYFGYWILVLLVLIGCQPQETSLPTRARLPTSISPTRTAAPDLFSTIPPTHTASPTVTQTVTTSPSPIATIDVVVENSTTPTQTLPSTATPLPTIFTFGRSAGGRELVGYRLGTGSEVLMIVGGIHTGFEANTVTLVEELQAHFTETPGDIQPEITLILIPVLNVDGLEYGRALRGRFNGNGVDLNRNWGCDWSAEAFFQDGTVNSGSEPFSEPETQALGSLIQRTRPATVIFYHAAANGVFAGNCPEGNAVSEDVARIYGQATGYPYEGEFGDYEVTGSAPAWINSLGIPALDVELATADGTEFSRNLNAILAVQRWIINAR